MRSGYNVVISECSHDVQKSTQDFLFEARPLDQGGDLVQEGPEVGKTCLTVLIQV